MCTFKYIDNYYLKIITSDIYNIYNSLISFFVDTKSEGEEKMFLKKTFIMEFFKHARSRKNSAMNPQEPII